MSLAPRLRCPLCSKRLTPTQETRLRGSLIVSLVCVTPHCITDLVTVTLDLARLQRTYDLTQAKLN